MRVVSLIAAVFFGTSAQFLPEETDAQKQFRSNATAGLKSWHQENLRKLPMREVDNIAKALNFFDFGSVEIKPDWINNPIEETGWFKAGKCYYARSRYYSVPGFEHDMRASGRLTIVDLNKVNWKAVIIEFDGRDVDIKMGSEAVDFVTYSELLYQSDVTKPHSRTTPTAEISKDRSIRFSAAIPYERAVSAVRMIAAECVGISAPF